MIVVELAGAVVAYVANLGSPGDWLAMTTHGIWLGISMGVDGAG